MAHIVTLIQLQSVLKASTLAVQTESPKAGGEQLTQNEGFKEVRRSKRHNTDEDAQTSKKAAVENKTSDALNTLPKKVVTRNYFTPLRITVMYTDTSSTEVMPHGKTGKPPLIVLTSATDPIQLRKQLKGVVKDSFEFRSTRNGTEVITKTMAEFQQSNPT
jgi:hypothetical protein